MLSICVYCMLSLFALETDQQRANFLFFFQKKRRINSHGIVCTCRACVARLIGFAVVLSLCGCYIRFSFFLEKSAIVDCMLATERATSRQCIFGRSGITNTFTYDSIRFDSIRFFFRRQPKAFSIQRTVAMWSVFIFNTIISSNPLHYSIITELFFVCVHVCTLISFRIIYGEYNNVFHRRIMKIASVKGKTKQQKQNQQLYV